MNSAKTAFGTKEWSKVSVNCVTGCSHNCRYCYARLYATERFHRMRRDQWKLMRIRPAEVTKKRKKCAGTAMFPTAHDITPEVLDPCTVVLRNLLEAGNTVLLVSKPHFQCVASICWDFGKYKEQLSMRFTIGADDDRLLRYWEPGAPGYQERLDSLKLAHREGFKTSVSIEPMLDSPNILRHVANLEPFVTDSIWIGKLNNIRSRAKAESDRDAIQRIVAGQTDRRIFEIYKSLGDNSLVSWKESIKRVVRIELPGQEGQERVTRCT